MADAFDRIQGTDSGKGDAFDRFPVEQEGFWKSAARTALQIPQGVLEATYYGIGTGLQQLLGMGEALDPEEIDRIRAISEREGIPFDEEKYREAAQAAAGTIPTISNVAGQIENYTGIPLEPKNKGQKLLRLASSAGKFQPGTSGQKATAAIVTPAVSAGLQAARVPETIADLAGLAAGGGAGFLAPEASLSKIKQSGIPQRGFETLQKPRTVSENKMMQINTKLNKDFKTTADKIIKESPVGETFENLRTNPAFKQESRELLNQAQVIADKIPGTIETTGVKKAIAEQSEVAQKGFIPSEYDKQYAKFVKQQLEDIPDSPIRPGQLVEQYRKNNSELSEYFEPGQSKAFNRAKRDALLDQNRAIANFMEKSFPESQLAPVFKDGNAQWTRIMDAETVDGFVTDFTKGKINFRKGHLFFDDRNTERIFKRALGDKYPQFEQLMTDMLGSERGYKMLQVAKKKGFHDLFNAGKYYLLHPWAGVTRTTAGVGKDLWKGFINSFLDKPKFGFTWKQGIDNLKKGNFAEAQKDFQAIRPEVLPAQAKPPAMMGETISVKGERMPSKPAAPKLLEAPKEKPTTQKPTAFTTSKGSQYEITPEGTTIRTKAERPEHPGEKGIQPKSEKTWYITPEDSLKLSEVQAKGADKKIVELPNGQLGVQYTTGKDAGKIERRTLVDFAKEPKEGMLPVESWNGGERIHFGNEITEVKTPPSKTPTAEAKAAKLQVLKDASDIRQAVEIIIADLKMPQALKEERLRKLNVNPRDIYPAPKASQAKLAEAKAVKPAEKLTLNEIKTVRKAIEKKEREIIEPVVGKDVYENQYKNKSFDGQREFWDKYEKKFSEKDLKTLEELPYENENLHYLQKDLEELKASYNRGQNKQESLSNVIKDARKAFILHEFPENRAKIQHVLDLLEKNGHTKKEIADEIFRVMKRDLSPSDAEYVLRDLFGSQEAQKAATQKIEAKAAKPKAPKKTKLEALEEAKKIAQENLKKRNEQVYHEKNKITKAERRKQLEAAEKRIKDLEEMIAEAKPKKKADTAPKIAEKIKKVERQDISKKGLKEQKLYLEDRISEALAHPSDELNIIFDVPGDGTFKVHNTKHSLELFREKVEKLWPDKPLRAPSKRKHMQYEPHMLKGHGTQSASPTKSKTASQDIVKAEDKYKKVVQLERKIRDIEKSKTGGVSASMVGEGRYVTSDARKGNVKKQTQINKLENARNVILKEIEALLKNYPQSIKDKLLEEQYHKPMFGG